MSQLKFKKKYEECVFSLGIRITYSAPSFVEKLIDSNGILSIHHRRNIVTPNHPWFNVICTKKSNIYSCNSFKTLIDSSKNPPLCFFFFEL